MTTTILQGDCRVVLPTLGSETIQCCVTSPSYWGLRDYGHPDQIGLEATPEQYVDELVRVFREVRRVLRDDGTLWLNLGDSYATAWSSSGAASGGANDEISRPALASGAMPRTQPNRMRAAFESSGLKEKDLVGIPWRVALALQADGWWLRSDVIWSKPNCTPSSVHDRPTTAHEYLFLLSKRARYFYDADAIREPHADPRESKNGRTKLHGQASLRPRGNLDSTERWYNPAGRNKRSVWTIPTEPFGDGHFAVMPRALVKPCILAGTSERGCCANCGAPWVRNTEAKRLVDGEPRSIAAARNTSRRAPSRAQGIGHGRITTSVETLGWEQSCSCDAPPPRTVHSFGPFRRQRHRRSRCDRARTACGPRRTQPHVRRARAATHGAAGALRATEGGLI